MPSLAFAEGTVVPSEKDETVYVYASPDGTVKSTEVETILKNPDGAAELADSSTLSHIEGKDDKTFTGAGDAMVWAAEGDSVTYTGETTLAAPVTMRATYMLDGREIAPEQLAGKAGHVVIRYDFANRSATTATVNGASQTIFTPFTCITAIMLDGEGFKNVKVENGKVINDGDDTIVAGYAMPGLKESLGPVADDADVPDHFTVEADVTDFALKSTMTIVTAGLMSDLDTDSLNMGDFDGASALTDAMGQLINGSEQLTSGLDALASGLSELEEGAAGIHSGAETLSGGLYALAGDSGLMYLYSGANALPSAIGLIGDAAGEMKAGLTQAAQGLEAAASTEAYAGALATMQSNKEKIVGDGKMTEADYSAVVTALTQAQASSTAVSQIAGQLTASAAKIDELTTNVATLKEKAAALAGGIYTASETASQLAAGAEQLESYTAQLSEAVPQLAQGAQTAADGSKTLTEGMRTFNDQGVSQLVNTLQSDYGGMLDRMNALADAAKSYTNFAGITPGTTGTVKFVIEVDAIARD